MKEKIHVSHSMEIHPHEDLEGFDALAELALDMRSSYYPGVLVPLETPHILWQR